MAVQQAGEDVRVLQRCARLPNHLDGNVIETFAFLHMVHAGKKLGVEAHLRENGGHLTGVTKRIDLPTDAGTSAGTEGVVKDSASVDKHSIKIESPMKVMLNILQAECELINDALVVHSGLIVHAPCSAGELQTTLVNQLFNYALHLLCLFLVPFGEERGLHLNEATTGVLQQFSNN